MGQYKHTEVDNNCTIEYIDEDGHDSVEVISNGFSMGYANDSYYIKLLLVNIRRLEEERDKYKFMIENNVSTDALNDCENLSLINRVTSMNKL